MKRISRFRSVGKWGYPSFHKLYRTSVINKIVGQFYFITAWGGWGIPPVFKEGSEK